MKAVRQVEGFHNQRNIRMFECMFICKLRCLHTPLRQDGFTEYSVKVKENDIHLASFLNFGIFFRKKWSLYALQTVDKFVLILCLQ